jgi:hypothetical protein
MRYCHSCGTRKEPLRQGYNICNGCWEEYGADVGVETLEDQELTRDGGLVNYVANTWTGEVERKTVCPREYLVVYEDEELPNKFMIE